MQYGLSAGKQKLPIILVQWNSMQVTKGTWRMHEQCVPSSLSPSPAQEPGNEASDCSLPSNSTACFVCPLVTLITENSTISVLH